MRARAALGLIGILNLELAEAKQRLTQTPPQKKKRMTVRPRRADR